MMDEYLESMEEDMVGVAASLQKELAKVRTGRATPKLLDGLQVEIASYGAVMPINQLATVQAPDARLLVVTPWDKSTLTDLERGIVAAGLGLNPSNDGQVIRVPVPALTKERRLDLVKQVRRAGEDAKVRLRHVRREYNDIFKNGEKDGDISEDENRRLQGLVQVSTDKHIEALSGLIDGKEAEVLEV
jgi:ribosome recycling factor